MESEHFQGAISVAPDRLRGWHVVASSGDLVLRHVFHARVGSYNLALWRSDAGLVNAWENRCPHRSVPLSMGQNLGQVLRCQYHGWRFVSDSGECTLVPAQPQDPANRVACVSTFDCVEQDGWVWVALRRPGAFTLPALANSQTRVPLRAVVMHVPAATLQAALQAEWGDATPESAQSPVLRLVQPGGSLRLFMQVQSEDSCILHAQWLPESALDLAQTLDLHRKFSQRFGRLRDRLESQAGAALSLVLQEPIAIPIQLSERRRQQVVQVLSKTQAAQDIVAFELGSAEGMPLHGFDAGAHIEVQTPGGLLRHYSLVNGPDERQHYVIGVKREAASRGGSQAMCEALQPGDRLHVGMPVNRFALHPSGVSVLVAGGIGITPLLAMAQQLHASQRDYVLHYFVRAAEHVAFRERLQALASHVQLHIGLDLPATAQAVADILRVSSPEHHLYVCGPGPMIDLVVQTAQRCAWPDEQVHREYFGNDKLAVRPDDKSFDVVLQRSGKRASVPPGRSIADIARELGIAVNTVCEQGVCGTCETPIIAGEADHRDVYLSPKERASQRCTMICVSRAKSATLVLDL